MNNNGAQPYWDGDKWVMPVQAQPERDNSNVIAAGFVFAILLPIVGLVIGLTQINRGREGLWVVLASVGGFVFWLYALSGGI